jgi:hypothetical protein
MADNNTGTYYTERGGDTTVFYDDLMGGTPIAFGSPEEYYTHRKGLGLPEDWSGIEERDKPLALSQKLGKLVGGVQDKIEDVSKGLYDKLGGKLLGAGKEGSLAEKLGGQKGLISLTGAGTSILKGVVDDDKATTYTGAEIGADAVGIGASIATGDMAGMAKGIRDVYKNVKGRKDAREEELKEVTDKGMAAEAKKQAQGARGMQGVAGLYEKGGLIKKKNSRIKELEAQLKYIKKEKNNPSKQDIVDDDYRIHSQFKGGGKIESNFPYLSGGYIEKYKLGSKVKKSRPSHLKYQYEDGGKITDESGRIDESKLGPGVTAERQQAYLDAPFYKKFFGMGEGRNPNVTYGYGPMVGPGRGAKFLNWAKKTIPKVRKTIQKTPVINKLMSKEAWIGSMAKWPLIGAMSAGEKAGVFPEGKANLKEITSDNNPGAFKPWQSKFEKGGMTKGPTHEQGGIPMTVKSTGEEVELEGGEGVFDKIAMNKLDKYKASGNVKEAGKLVFAEMNSWKDAGTARYGKKIKDY